MTNLLVKHDYSHYDSDYNQKYTRRLIDGTITGSNKCTAYCSYKHHAGFLTADLQAVKNCIDKNCIHYHSKPRSYWKNETVKVEYNKIIDTAQMITKDMEGLKVVRAERDDNNNWVLYYVSIAGYLLDDVTEALRNKIGEHVEFQNLNYNFDIAAQLIFGTNHK